MLQINHDLHIYTADLHGSNLKRLLQIKIYPDYNTFIHDKKI